MLAPVLLFGASLAIGYLLGSSNRRPTVSPSEEDDGGSQVDEVSDRDLSAITAGLMEPCKMVCHFIYWCLILTKSITGSGREDRSQDDQRKNRSTVSDLESFRWFHSIICADAGEFNLNCA